MRRLLPLLLMLAGCALRPISEPRRPNPDNEPTIVPTAITVEKPVYVVERGSVTAQLFKTGRIAPVDQERLTFAIGGQIAALTVDEGALVNAGDVVAELDTSAWEQALISAEADLTLAQQQLAIAQTDNATDQRRAEIGVELAQLELDFAVAEAGDSPSAQQALTVEKRKRELELAQLNLSQFENAVDLALVNQVAQAEREVESVKTLLAQSTLIAPKAGTVMVVNMNVGDSVAAGDTVLVVADLAQLEVQFSLLDRELQLLTEGMTAVGINPLRPENTLPMTVRQLPYPYGTGAQESDSDNIVRVAFDDASNLAGLEIGDRVEVAIVLEQKEGVLWLPPAALREFNGRRFVVVQEGQTQQRVDIKIGLEGENQIEIVSGVTEGQTVVGP